MVHFVGAGPGAPDLITVRGKRLIEEADVIIYAGSLVNQELLKYGKPGCSIHNSAVMTLEEVIGVIVKAEDEGKTTVRLHTGDQSLYGAVREQMDMLDELGIEYDSCPGVSSFCGAAAALDLEYTLPGISQSLIITRMEGRTAVPEEEKLSRLASCKAGMAIFLSAGLAVKVKEELLLGGLKPETPAAIVYKATWPQEKKVLCTVGTLDKAAKENDISKTALILVGEALRHSSLACGREGTEETEKSGYERSKLYDPEYETQYRKAAR